MILELQQDVVIHKNKMRISEKVILHNLPINLTIISSLHGHCVHIDLDTNLFNKELQDIYFYKLIYNIL